MMKDVARTIETGPLAEIGLIAFLVAFLLVVVYALTLSKRRRDHAKNLPLDDVPELPRDPNNGDPA